MPKVSRYYNEIDEFCCAWLSNLMDAGAISPGKIDNRSIVDVRPEDLTGFTRCHFFAGIGVWDYTLNCAEWGDRPVWTGSCPCQSFSTAGKRKGFDDARHLWPIWFQLIQKCRPVTVFGEQVASKDALSWLDLVSSDLEGADYSIGAIDTCAASVGAPHIRQRLYWVAESSSQRRQQISGSASCNEEANGRARWDECESNSNYILSGDGESKLALSNGRKSSDPRPQRSREHGQQQEDGGVGGLGESSTGRRGSGRPSETVSREKSCGKIERSSHVESLDEFEQGYIQRGGSLEHSSQQQMGFPGCSREPRSTDVRMGLTDSPRPQPRNETASPDRHRNSTQPTSIWSDCTWLPCIDGKARPTERRLLPMADGSSADLGYLRDGDSYILSPLIQKSIHRIGRLRGYGNAIVAPQAQAFIEAYLECRP